MSATVTHQRIRDSEGLRYHVYSGAPYPRVNLKKAMDVLWSGFANGCLIVLFAVSFSTVYLSTRVFNIALAATISAAPFIAWSARSHGLSPIASWTIAVISAAFISLSCELLSHWRLYCRGASSGLNLIASLGNNLIIGQTVVMIFGNDNRTLRSSPDQLISIGAFRLSQSQWYGVVGSACAVTVIALLLYRTEFGLLVRGLADNPDLIAQKGYNVRRLRSAIFAMSGGLAGLASLLTAFGQGFSASAGEAILLPGIAAVILGGGSLVTGPVLAGFALGILRSSVTWYASAPWQDPVTFLVLLVALLLRPRGNGGTSWLGSVL